MLHDWQERMSYYGNGGSSSLHVNEGLVPAALAIQRVFEGGRTGEQVDLKLDVSDGIWNSDGRGHDRQSQAW